MGLFIVAVLSFGFWSYPRFSCAFATAHPLLLSGSAKGIFLVVVCSIFCFGERGLLGHILHFQSFLNVNCTVHSSQIEICKAVGKCKISGYLGGYRSTSRKTHPTHRNITNNPILNFTQENITQHSGIE